MTFHPVWHLWFFLYAQCSVLGEKHLLIDSCFSQLKRPRKRKRKSL